MKKFLKNIFNFFKKEEMKPVVSEPPQSGSGIKSSNSSVEKWSDMVERINQSMVEKEKVKLNNLQQAIDEEEPIKENEIIKFK